jgi:hypothetical protein
MEEKSRNVGTRSWRKSFNKAVGTVQLTNLVNSGRKFEERVRRARVAEERHN